MKAISKINEQDILTENTLELDFDKEYEKLDFGLCKILSNNCDFLKNKN